MAVLNLIAERARLEKLNDAELLREISALMKQFSEVQIRLNEAKKAYAARKSTTKEGVKREEPKKSIKFGEVQIKKEKEISEVKLKERDIKKNTGKDNVTIKGFSYNDPSVPAGWGIKLRPQGPRNPPKKSFCDPKGLIFLSRKEAYEYMVMTMTMMMMVLMMMMMMTMTMIMMLIMNGDPMGGG